MSRWPLRSFKLHRKNTASKFGQILSRIKADDNDSSSQGDVRSSDTWQPVEREQAGLFTLVIVYLSSCHQVKEELDLAPEDGKIFKLIGPALVPQELSEARSNVEKRIDYIAGELKRKEDLMAELDKKQDEAREKMQEVQVQMQKLQQAPA